MARGGAGASLEAVRPAPLAEALGGRQQQIDVDPPENVVYRPMGLEAGRVDADTSKVVFLITPFKMVTIMLPNEAKAILIEKLTGGIVIPS